MGPELITIFLLYHLHLPGAQRLLHALLPDALLAEPRSRKCALDVVFPHQINEFVLVLIDELRLLHQYRGH